MTDNEKALDILQKLDFFHGQRAGRELWNEKPTDVQNEDIDNFKRDVAFLEDFINRQNSNIEELKSKNANLTSDLSSLRTEIEGYKKHIDNDIIYVDAVRAEAVKEFAERLKTKVDGWYYDFAKFDDTMDALMEIANLVKEFTEGDQK